MLTSELQNEIDEKWNACWPLSQLKPIVILDLVSYFFFIKAISGEQQTNNKSGMLPGFTLTGLKGKKEEVTGDYFNDADDKNICWVFADANGLIELEKAYSRHQTYGIFLNGGLLMPPTSKLLETSLGILKIIDGAADDIKPSIFSYLLNKSQYVDANGHAYLPEYLVDLLIAITRPAEKDVVLNPTLGNGSLLVGCARYIANNSLNQSVDNIDSQRLKGLESDTTSLRVSAMNLVLNGIKNSNLKSLDIFESLNSFNHQEATIILSNLIFLSGENNMNMDATALRDAIKKDIYYLNFILKDCKDGTRCAIVVPGLLLYHQGIEFINIRKEITDNFKLSALISIDDKHSAEFNGASVLVFSKETSTLTDKVWFYKLKRDAAKTNDNEDLAKQTDDIAAHFKNSGNNKKTESGFYIDADEIRAKIYNFSYGEYVPEENKQPSPPRVATIKPGGFPNLEPEIRERLVSHLKPALGAGVEIKAKASQQIVQEQKVVFDKGVKKKELPDGEKSRPPAILKKLPIRKIISFATLFIVLIGIGYFLYRTFFVNKDRSPENKTPAAAIVNADSADAIRSSSFHSIDSVVNSMNSYLSRDSANHSGQTYTVISKAFFYSLPNIDNPQAKYITNAGGGILTSLKEENGFVYVNYINSKGRSTKGWLNKDDLSEIGSDATETVPVETKKELAVEKKTKDDSNESPVNSATQYVITTKAWFYREPDINSRRDLFLNKPNHIRLSPLEEKNGFIYVVYQNSKGDITRGWLNKKDLEVVQE